MSQKQRLILCTYPSIFSDIILTAILKTNSVECVGLIYSTRIFSAQETWLNAAIRLCRQSGIEYAWMQCCQTEIYRGLRYFRRSSAKNIPVFYTKNINGLSGIHFLQQQQADIILLANFNQKVSAEVINTATQACINLHPSKLPAYKGVDPVFSALAAHESELGISLHHVNQAFDSGELISQAQLTVDRKRSVFFHQVGLFELGTQLIINYLHAFTPSSVNDISLQGGDYYSWPTRQQIQQFKRQSGSLINWVDYWAILRHYW